MNLFRRASLTVLALGLAVGAVACNRGPEIVSQSIICTFDVLEKPEGLAFGHEGVEAQYKCGSATYDIKVDKLLDDGVVNRTEVWIFQPDRNGKEIINTKNGPVKASITGLNNSRFQRHVTCEVAAVDAKNIFNGKPQNVGRLFCRNNIKPGAQVQAVAAHLDND